MHRTRRLAQLALAALVGTGTAAEPQTTPSAAFVQSTSVAWTSANFSADGAFLLTNDRVSGVDRTWGTHLWDARTGEHIDVSRYGRAFVQDPVRGRDAKSWLVEWGERGLKLQWRRPAQREVTLTQESATRIVEAGITGSHKRLAYILDERAIRAYDFDNGRLRWELPLEGIALYEFPGVGAYLSAAPDGRWLVFREKTGNLWIIDTATGKTRTLDTGQEPDKLSRHKWNHGALFTRDGTKLYLGHSHGMDVVSTRTWTVLDRIRPAAPCAAHRNSFMHPAAETPAGEIIALMDIGLACTIDGRTLKSGFDPTMAFARWNDKHSGFLDHNRQSLSADVRRYALYNYVADRISVWEPATNAFVREVRTEGYGTVPAHPDRRAVSLAPDGKRVVVFDNVKGGPVSAMWDVETNRRVFILTIPAASR